MKKRILNYCKNVVNSNNNISEEKTDEILYGLEAIYLTITKLIIIFILAIILGIFKEVLLLSVCYNIIRITAFGLHATKSIYCLISSLLMFVGGVYLINYISLNLIIKFVLCLLSIYCIAKYAPADTEKRPIINIKKRRLYKLISTISAVIMSILIIIFSNQNISNYLLLGMIESCIMIHPLVYKIFNLKYDNYKNYIYSLNN